MLLTFTFYKPGNDPNKKLLSFFLSVFKISKTIGQGEVCHVHYFL